MPKACRLLVALWFMSALAPLGAADELKPETRNYDLEDLTLDLKVDLEGRSVAGSATYLFKPLTDKFATMLLHCDDSVVLAVAAGERGKPEPARRVRLRDGILRIDLAHEYAKDTPLEVRIEYESHPVRGLYFFGPTPERPDVPAQVWSQGEGQDNRHWFPCYDEPDDRFKVTQRIRVPEGYTVIANGVLQESKTDGPAAPPAEVKKGGAPAGPPAPAAPPGPRETTFVYRFDQNLVTYLVSLIVGKFDVVEEDCDGVPMRYYVPPGQKSATRLAFSLTPDMVRFFSEYTGCKYPYPSYAQTTVWDFIYGGMENSSVTTLNQRALHAPRAHVDYQADGLVAHELAHQWFGDLLTCKDWKEMWLNEGFATYFADLWTEHHEGPEVFAIERLQTVEQYVGASTPELLARLKRETGKEKKPLELPEGMNYNKGSVVLHTLRGLLGDEVFRKGIQAYVAQHKDSCVTSEDLRLAFQGASGQDLTWFFDQWVYGAGVPDLAVEYEWHEAVKKAVVRVRQRQPVSVGRDVYRFPVTLGFGYAKEPERGSKVETRRVEVTARQQEFEIALAEEPRWVRFDVGSFVPKRLEFPRSLAMLEAQLLRDAEVTGRYEAAKLLGAEGKAGRAALEKAAKAETFDRVRTRIVESLAEADAEGALATLLETARDPKSEVRKAAVRGLGKLAADKVETALAERAEWDESDEVREAALRGLAACRAKSAPEVLRRALRWPSYREMLRGAAIEGLATLGDMKAIPDLLPFVTRSWEAGAMHRVTKTAIEQLAAFAPRDPRVVEAVLKALGDPYFRTRSAAATALGRMRPAKAAAALLDRAKVETDPGVKDALEAALRKLCEADAAGGGAGGEAEGKSADELDAAAAALEDEAAAMAVDAEVKKLEAQKLRLRAKAQRAKEGGGAKPREAEKR